MAGHKPWSEIRAKLAPEVLAGAAALTTSDRLSGLAAARGLTVDEVAERLHARWETLPPLVSPGDVAAITLREVVEAIGGDLEIRAIFPDAEYRINTGEHLNIELVVRKSGTDDSSDRAWYPPDDQGITSTP